MGNLELETMLSSNVPWKYQLEEYHRPVLDLSRTRICSFWNGMHLCRSRMMILHWASLQKGGPWCQCVCTAGTTREVAECVWSEEYSPEDYHSVCILSNGSLSLSGTILMGNLELQPLSIRMMQWKQQCGCLSPMIKNGASSSCLEWSM